MDGGGSAAGRGWGGPRLPVHEGWAAKGQWAQVPVERLWDGGLVKPQGKAEPLEGGSECSY